ncbi:MAG: peptidase S55 [Synergistetes bacterium]|nr:peptidase S55 [Synergistota bacterium]MDK2871055.1 hypothetical protein [bacterium]
MFLKRIFIFTLLMFLFSCSYAFSVEVMPLRDVKPGMKGEVRTVFKGTEIKSFPAEIISVIKSTRGDRHFILIRAYGPLIEKLGGIAAGMSGSPFYVNGRIVGAIGYGWKMSDHRLGLVTPIEEMMRVWRRKDLRDQIDWSVDLREKEKNGEDKEKEQLLMFASGLSPRGFSILNSGFERYGIKLVEVPMAGSVSLARNVKLAPGAAIGALLSCGDISIGAIGTLSYLEGNKFLAFAHPFLSRGSVNYFLTTAYIHECIPSIEFPFKLGTPGDIVGVVNQDRIEAIGGIIGRYPLSIPMRFTVKSLDERREKESFVRVVYDDGILDQLLKAIVLSTFDLGWGRVGDGTVRLEYEIEGKNMPRVFKRVNYFYSSEDVSKTAFEAFKRDLFFILNNEFTEVFPLGVSVEAEFTSLPKILYIKDVHLENKELSRGEELRLKITLLPYRKKPIEKEVTLKVKEDFPQGKAYLIVRGGGIYPPDKGKGKEEEKTYKSLKEILDDLEREENNNEIIVELVSAEKLPEKTGENDDSEKDGSLGGNEEKEENESSEVKLVFDTDFYVDGYVEKEVVIR